MTKAKSNTFSKNQKITDTPVAITHEKTFSAIVAIGASAGGLETLELFFQHMPTNTPLAFVIITHLGAQQINVLPNLLQRHTTMKITMIASGMVVEPSQIYILPPGNNVLIEHNVLQLVNQEEIVKQRLPLDFFLRSLANDQGQKAVCIILSGTGSDGTIGLRALSEKGGLIIVQSTHSARYDGMPKNAITTGLVDYILPPEKMPEFLSKYLRYMNDKTIQMEDKLADELQQILMLLYNRTGHDFSLYKPNTIFRRIQKRMSIQQLNSLGVYIRYLHQHPHEIDVLFKELLINVTNFFRDPEAFERLELQLQEYLKDKPQDYWVRVWVPGCATGEEVYSIAILLQECISMYKRNFNVQIFGTDIDDAAIEIARAGIYPANIAMDISPTRLSHFFTKEGNSYKINADVRKMIIFAVQNVIKDPPFTKLDVLSCRNLLIYLSAQLQKKILPLFHYSLKSNGLLFLGSSETIGKAGDLFTVLDRRWKLFERKGNTILFQAVIDFPSATQLPEIPESLALEKTMQQNEPKLSKLVESILLENYAPAAVIIDEKNNIVYIYGHTGKFLEFAPGEVRLDILEMVRAEIKMKLASAIRKANTQRKEIIVSGLQIKDSNEFKYINLKIKPIHEAENSNRRLLLIIFEDIIFFEQADKRGTKGERDKKISQLEQELKYTKESLQTTIEELETSNEELKSSNEELQSTNEELQSTNEEIETSKEELQSLNEELTTVNTELESRVEQLSSANDDIKNLLDNTEVATIFLDKDLCIKRFTPKATDIINLISADIGRPIGHIVSNLQYEKLVDDARFVLKSLESRTTEVQNKNGHWYIIRIIPYRTVTNVIDGVVITFLNIHAQKQAEEKLSQLTKDLQELQDLNNSLLKANPNPVLILDRQLKIVSVNKAFCTLFKVKAEEIKGQSVFKINHSLWNIAEVKKLLEELLPNQPVINDYKLSRSDHQTHEKHFTITAHKVSNSSIILTIMTD